jgi:cytochrome bd-type quinol oxidase subunit 2
MFELYVRLTTQDVNKQESKVKAVYILASVVNFICFVASIFLALKITHVLRQAYQCPDLISNPDNCAKEVKDWTNFMNMFGYTTASFIVVLLAALILSYILMVKALNQHTMKELKAYKKTVTCLFFIFTFSYGLRAIFLAGEGHYQGLPQFYRNEL